MPPLWDWCFSLNRFHRDSSKLLIHLLIHQNCSFLWLSCTTCTCTQLVSPFTYWRTSGNSEGFFLAIANKVATSIYASVFVWIPILFLRNKYARIQLLCYMVVVCLVVYESDKLSYRLAVPFTFPWEKFEWSNFSLF